MENEYNSISRESIMNSGNASQSSVSTICQKKKSMSEDIWNRYSWDFSTGLENNVLLPKARF